MIQLEHINDTIIMTQNTRQLNKRQDKILAFINKQGIVSMSQIVIEIKKVTRITIIRDLEELLRLNLLVRQGAGRGITYSLSPHYDLLKRVEVEKYFQDSPDKRQIKRKFNFDIFSQWHDIFTKEESKHLEKLNQNYQNNLKKLSDTLLKKEFERLTIELSWKSSQIEGNTYSLLETERLLIEKKESFGHSQNEATMILNHKKALDYVRKNSADFKRITVTKIIDIHRLLTHGLDISKSLRKTPVGITGTRYSPIDNQWQIKEALQKTCVAVNKEKNFLAKAIILMAMIAYIQPFEDGNKRTSRLMGNAILIANNACPLSYRNIDEVEYKKAVILFYEQNNIEYFKQLFIKQFEFAVQNYFRT